MSLHAELDQFNWCNLWKCVESVICQVPRAFLSLDPAGFRDFPEMFSQFRQAVSRRGAAANPASSMDPATEESAEEQAHQGAGDDVAARLLMWHKEMEAGQHTAEEVLRRGHQRAEEQSRRLAILMGENEELKSKVVETVEENKAMEEVMTTIREEVDLMTDQLRLVGEQVQGVKEARVAAEVVAEEQARGLRRMEENFRQLQVSDLLTPA